MVMPVDSLPVTHVDRMCSEVPCINQCFLLTYKAAPQFSLQSCFLYIPQRFPQQTCFCHETESAHFCFFALALEAGKDTPPPISDLGDCIAAFPPPLSLKIAGRSSSLAGGLQHTSLGTTVLQALLQLSINVHAENTFATTNHASLCL